VSFPRSATTCGCCPRVRAPASGDQPAAGAGGIVHHAGKVNRSSRGRNQIAFEVIGNDVTVSFAAEAGAALNAFEPRHRPQPVQELMHLERLRHPARALRRRHQREPERMAQTVRESIGLYRALTLYTATRGEAEVRWEALATGQAYSMVTWKKINLLSEGHSSPEILAPVIT